MAKAIPADVLGIIVSGDLGPLTIYTDRFGRKVSFPRSPPKEPPTPHQVWVRNRFRLAQAQYMKLSSEDRSAWEAIANQTSLCMTGQNLLIHVAMKHAFTLFETLMRQSGVSVEPPDPV